MADQFQEWEAAELFCPKCGQARPVKKKILLALPGGDKYDYVCAVCGELLGGKLDHQPNNFSRLIRKK